MLAYVYSCLCTATHTAVSNHILHPHIRSMGKSVYLIAGKGTMHNPLVFLHGSICKNWWYKGKCVWKRKLYFSDSKPFTFMEEISKPIVYSSRRSTESNKDEDCR